MSYMQPMTYMVLWLQKVIYVMLHHFITCAVQALKGCPLLCFM